MKGVKVLVVDDDESFSRILVRELTAMTFQVAFACSGEEAIKQIGETEFDVVLLDVHLPGMDGVTTLKVLRDLAPTTEVVMLTGQGALDTAVPAMKLGAYDYLTKPCNLDELETLINKAWEKKMLSQQNVILKHELARLNPFNEFIGKSPALKSVLEIIAKVALSDSTVLIQGESGTGKELVANTIHGNSLRKDNPFIVVDCSSLYEELLQSELFGHEKGAFTGAIALKHGLFEVANGGTIFLDEMAQLSLSLQAKLLRVIETATFRRVGGIKDIKVDVRVIAAANRDVQQMVGDGHFREDLYYRINAVTVVVPPLRERKSDIPLLAHHFLAKKIIPGREVLGFSKESMELLMKYDWPGNVRELKNMVERAIILAEGKYIQPDDLPANLRMNLDFLSKNFHAEYPSLEEVERLYITKLLNEFKGNRANVAGALKISERSLYRKLKEYDLS
ncbi:MAG: sigma-54-dependent Fis family transcriptional regulator [Acidobacteria bacterium]|nr:sigma-54-dependent Fis family transcriptional regulator [Acidobacteriota bacterium]MBI3655752.1 sigma-54-dependent Fis family transcriptional regulator [Acidobacteriota bacterium]